MTTVDVRRLDAIVDGASRLPIESQEYILATIKGMLFTRNLLIKQADQLKDSTSQNHMVSRSLP